MTLCDFMNPSCKYLERYNVEEIGSTNQCCVVLGI